MTAREPGGCGRLSPSDRRRGRRKRKHRDLSRDVVSHYAMRLVKPLTLLCLVAASLKTVDSMSEPQLASTRDSFRRGRQCRPTSRNHLNCSRDIAALMVVKNVSAKVLPSHEPDRERLCRPPIRTSSRR